MLAIADNSLRLVNFCFMVITMAFIAQLLNTRQGHNSARVNYCMFAVAFGILTDSIYGLFANFFEQLAWPIILFVFDFLNFVFFFTAGTVLAVGIRAHNCNNEAYRNSNKIVRGSETRCRVAQAAVAFFYFSMAIFLVKGVFSIMKAISEGPFGSGSSFGFGSRRKRRSAGTGVPTTSTGVPTVSEV
ncbi:hypothetical protein KAFR_0G03700 [Kazachstania africana CBS 2517]|uniref:MARVEL domain-containing protein n=1 Tax=Kazachstania africana (strain ATCC 22294 / BCRC 22015 / CBS 2517 / CECT 1963 / NBRC 1671 / NRRL Y-8276) TaxID=1071382 RepID=H2AYF3_KAZAF|nr:hypothetical protein KAFR_0G03700 [Kazachstania africana CBS 2517]CCF59403.1 hypothetical protein KAFR_0G03700 [Kazachstania africana CBS 2517]